MTDRPLVPKRDQTLYVLVVPGISAIYQTAHTNRNWCIHKAKEFCQRYPKWTVPVDAPWRQFVEASKKFFGRAIVIAEYDLRQETPPVCCQTCTWAERDQFDPPCDNCRNNANWAPRDESVTNTVYHRENDFGRSNNPGGMP